MMKKRLAILLCVLMLATLVFACGKPADNAGDPTGTNGSTTTPTNTAAGGSPDQETYRIGLACPLSGPSASYGDLMLYGAQTAVDEINAKGGVNGKKLELVA